MSNRQYINERRTKYFCPSLRQFNERGCRAIIYSTILKEILNAASHNTVLPVSYEREESLIFHVSIAHLSLKQIEQGITFPFPLTHFANNNLLPYSTEIQVKARL